MSVEIEPARLTPGKTIRLLVYGLPGVGKTRFAASAPGTLIIRPPLDHTDSVPPEHEGNVREVEVDDHSKLLDVLQWGQQGGFREYNWVWLDSISLLEETGLDDVFQAAIDRNPARREHGPDKGEFGVNRSRIGRFVRDVVGLSKTMGFNFGVTAHVMEWYNPVEEEEVWTPLYGARDGSTSAKLCGYMNIVAYMQANDKEDEDRQELLLVDPEGFVGKDQFNCFPRLKSGKHGLVNPTMADLEAAIAKARRPQRKRARTTTKTSGTRKRRRS